MKFTRSLLAALSAFAIGLNCIIILPGAEAATMEIEEIIENTAISKAGGTLAAGTVEIKLSALEAANYKVSVPVYISDNPGFSGLSWGFEYDNRLTLSNYMVAGILTSLKDGITYGIGDNPEKDIFWVNFAVNPNSMTAEEVYCQGDGQIWNFTFVVPSDAKAGEEYAVNLLASSNGTPQEITTPDGITSSTLVDGVIRIKADETTTTIPEICTGKCGDDLTWVLKDGVLTISGTGDMYNYAAPWYDYRDSIKSVIIEKGVTSIGESSFENCTSLTSVTIGNSVTSIGDEAFQYCTSLTSVTMGNSVRSIGDNAFEYCRNLTSVTIPDSVTSIGRNAFIYCESLTSVTIPDSVTSIEDCAFCECKSLESVIIGNSVTSIGYCAFYQCKRLESVTIGNSVMSIGEMVFFECDSLSIVTIPDSVTSIGCDAFGWCENLTSVAIKNPKCVIYDSNSTIYEDATIYGYSGSTAEEYANKYYRKFVFLDSAVTTATTTTITTTTTTTTSRPTTTTTTTTSRPTTTTTTTTSRSTTTITTTTTKQTTTTTLPDNPSSFEWGVDNWNFLNSSSYFTHYNYYLSSSYLNKLRSNLSNKEWTRAQNIKNRSWGGSCYGMSSLVVLSKAGFLPYSDYTSGADCLHDMQNPSQNSQIESLINYYQLLQVTDITQQRRYGVINSDNKTNINNIINKLKTGSPVLIGYRRDGWGGHAVVAYDVSYGSWTWNGVTYQGQIKIIDPNSSRSYDNRYCIYFNTSTYNWIIPAYNPISSVYGAIFTNITNYIDEINYGGYLNGSVDYALSENYIASLNMSEISDNYSVSKVRLVNDNFEYVATDADDIIPNKFYIEGGESEGTDGYLLKDAKAGYKVSQDNPTRMDLSIDYENCLFNASSAAGREIIFDNNGIVSITSESADCTAEMICNDGYYDTDWYGIKVSCSGADNIILEQTDGGYYLSGNILENVTVGAFNNDVSAKAKFSTNADKVYIYEIDENTVGISIDTDGDGTYETKLETTEPADEPTDNGDINGDGNIDIADATMVLMMYAYAAAGMDMSEYTEEQLSAADIDCDGKVSISDATYILTYYAQNAAGMNPSWEDILKQ